MPEAAKLDSQRSWMNKVHEASYQALLDDLPEVHDRARLLSVSCPGSSEWLNAIPADSIGTRLDDQSIRICVGLTAWVLTWWSLIGAPAGSISCSRSAGPRSHHAALNDTLSRALRSAGVPWRSPSMEPTGLTRPMMSMGNVPMDSRLFPSLKTALSCGMPLKDRLPKPFPGRSRCVARGHCGDES